MELLTKMSGDSDTLNSHMHHLSLLLICVLFIKCDFSVELQPLVGHSLHIIEASRSHSETPHSVVDFSWNVMPHGDARKGKWRGNWRMEWVASILHTTSERGVSSITTADAHTSAASSRLNWCPRWFKWTRPFHQKTKSGFCACAITFQLASTPLDKYSSQRRDLYLTTHNNHKRLTFMTPAGFEPAIPTNKRP